MNGKNDSLRTVVFLCLVAALPAPKRAAWYNDGEMGGDTLSIKLVLSDIDGTLINDAGAIPAANRTAIRAFVAAGGQFCLASARPPRAMTALAQSLGLTVPLVSLNGALITTVTPQGTFTILHDQPLPAGAAAQITGLVTSKHLPISVNYMAGLDWIVAENDAWVRQEVAITGFAPTSFNAASLMLTKKPVHKLLCMGAPAAINQLEAAITAAGLAVAVSRSKPTYLEITHPQVSKAAALAFLTQHFGLEQAATMAIGDGDNDQPMIKAAGVGIAMGNGLPGALAAADHVVADNNHAGVAEALTRFA